MVFSASSARTLLEGQGDGTAYLVKYVDVRRRRPGRDARLSRVGLDKVRRVTPLLLVVAFVLLLLVLIPGFGVRINGARRWLGAGPLQFQPAEIMKLALVLHACAMIAARPKITRSLRAARPDLPARRRGRASSSPPSPTSAPRWSAPSRWRRSSSPAASRSASFLVAGVGAALVMLFALVEPYRRARLVSFLDPWAHAGTDGFQSVQGQIAIGSGGLFGLGPGQSVQKIFYLPEAHTDFILAVIGEELGLAGILRPARPVRHDRLRRPADRARPPATPTPSCSPPASPR